MILSNEPSLAKVTPDERDIALVRDISPDACLKSLPEAERDYLKIQPPEWLTPAEDLQKFFSHYNQLWAGGRVVWGHTVQANGILRSDGPRGAPGEVIYDPTGKTGPEELRKYARVLGALKGTQPEDPGLRRIADHLTNEFTRAFAMPVPQSVTRGLILLSTTFFHRPHLPNAKLTGSHYPILINDKYPGVVMVLPERWWPQRWHNLWLGLMPDAPPKRRVDSSAAVALKPTHHCVNCKAPMKKLGLAAHYQRKVEIDVCDACSLIWFDNTESVRVAGPGVVDLVKRIHKAMQSPRPLQPLPHTLPCPICTTPLKRVANISRFGRSSQLECPQKHGAIQSFTQFLAEKGFFRSFSWQDIKDLVQAGKRLTCVNCGASLEARPHDECPYCRSPVGMIDAARLASAIDLHGAASKLSLAPTVKQTECPCCGGAVDLTGEMVCPHCMAVIRPVEIGRALAASEKVESQVRENYQRQTEDVSRRKMEAIAALDKPRMRLPDSEGIRRLMVIVIAVMTLAMVAVGISMRKAKHIQEEEGADFNSDSMIGYTAVQKQGIENARVDQAMQTTPHAPAGEVPTMPVEDVPNARPGEPTPPLFDVTQSGDHITLVSRSKRHLRVTLAQYNDFLAQRCYMQNADGPAGQKNVEFKHLGESHDFTQMPCSAKVLQNAKNEYAVWDLSDGRYIFKSVSAFYHLSVTDQTNK